MKIAKTGDVTFCESDQIIRMYTENEYVYDVGGINLTGDRIKHDFMSVLMTNEEILFNINDIQPKGKRKVKK